MTIQAKRLEVTRRIEASAEFVFRIISCPGRHIDFDGSDMLRGTTYNGVINEKHVMGPTSHLCKMNGR